MSQPHMSSWSKTFSLMISCVLALGCVPSDKDDDDTGAEDTADTPTSDEKE